MPAQNSMAAQDSSENSTGASGRATTRIEFIAVDINGSVKGGTFEPINVDAFSRLEGGGSVTSSTAIFVLSQPDRGIHKFAHPVATLEHLIRWHRKHMEELGAESELSVSSLEDHISAVESFLEMESGAEVGTG